MEYKNLRLKNTLKKESLVIFLENLKVWGIKNAKNLFSPLNVYLNYLEQYFSKL